ncbi:MAG: S41 family peptidase [Bacteroidia bacterium]|nr:S41 family peptidase [Bacteroidia bacterium]
MGQQPVEASFLADFDTLTHHLLRYQPQLAIRQQVTGVDAQAEFAALRTQLAGVTDTLTFVRLCSQALNVCQDEHTGVRWPVLPLERAALGITAEDSAHFRRLNRKLYNHRTVGKPLALPVAYRDGKYQAFLSFSYSAVTVPSGAWLLSVNGIPVEAFVRERVRYKPLRWDRERNAFFDTHLFQDDEGLTPGDTLRLTFATLGGAPVALTVTPADTVATERPRYAGPGNPTAQLRYLPETGSVVVRMPQMTPLGPLLDELSGLRGQPIRRVVIDIRGNLGGDDGTWYELLESLVAEPLVCQIRVAAVPDPAIGRYTSDFDPSAAPLDGFQALPTAFVGLFDLQDTLHPSATTLGLRCPIYVLQDADIYSSAGALSEYAYMVPQLVSVGERTGYWLGRGIMPPLRVLPHTRLAFRYAASVDLAHVEKPLDCYHDHVEVPVEFPLAQAATVWQLGPGAYALEYSLENDAILKALLAGEYDHR